MEQRKRKSALENYVDGLLDPPEKLKKMADFYNSLRVFYRRKWNAALKFPCVQGVEINLFRMYDVVMSLGGWQKVSQQERWPDVAEMLGVGEDVVGGDHAIKILYMRYLSKYEQNETIGDIDEMIMDGEMSRTRGRQASSFATNDCPISNARQHDFIRRDERGNPSNEPDYSRVMRSLLSGLPNEVDFGVNVCTLLSHPGPRLLRLSHAPYIPTLLVAHCGIFDDEDTNLSDLYESWKDWTKRDFLAFWANSGAPEDFLKLFVPDALKIKLDPDGDLLHGLVCEYDVKNPISWRLNQIATIIRNFSFEPINRVTLTQCWPLMKFLFLCASCKYVPLYTAAMDTLSNIACDVNLSWYRMTHSSDFALLRIIEKGLKSNDKFVLIRSMEIITGLCMNDTNESILCDFLTGDMIDRISEIVCVKDIMMCVYALECLYQMSEMGAIPCDLISQRPRFVQQLVSMATLEAVSFGPAGLAGMKVVEYQPPGHYVHGGYHPQQTPSHPMHMNHPGHPGHHSNIAMHHGPMGTPGHHPVMAIHQGPPGTPVHPGHHGHHPGQHPGMVSGQHGYAVTPQRVVHGMVGRPQHNGLPQVVHIGGTPNRSGSHEKTQVDVLTEQWIRNNCITDPTCATPRGELYAAYVDDLRNQYHSLSGSLAMFSNIMKSIHHEVQFKMADNGLMMVAQGIRLVKPHKLAPAASVAVAPQPTANSHPLMKQILTKGPAQPGAVVNGTNGRSSNESSRSSTPVDDSKLKDEENPLPAKEKLVNGLPNGHAKLPNSEETKVVEKEADPNHDMMCEWDGCGKTFASSQSVLTHCLKAHMIDQLQPCKWPGCDGTPRSRWSLVTHLQDHHTQTNQLKAAAQRRREGLAPSKPTPYQKDLPRDIPQHPGYSKTAAFDAIRRHAFNYLPRDITDEPEGPVTKSIRLSSCLILRNLARYSSEGRHLLKRHERQFCWLALSRLESSHALAQLLAELNPQQEEEVQEEPAYLTLPTISA